MLSYQ